MQLPTTQALLNRISKKAKKKVTRLVKEGTIDEVTLFEECIKGIKRRPFQTLMKILKVEEELIEEVVRQAVKEVKDAN